jgi:hypothetical protein
VVGALLVDPRSSASGSQNSTFAVSARRTSSPLGQSNPFSSSPSQDSVAFRRAQLDPYRTAASAPLVQVKAASGRKARKSLRRTVFSTYCLITDSGAPPHEMMQYDRDQNAGLRQTRRSRLANSRRTSAAGRLHVVDRQVEVRWKGHQNMHVVRLTGAAGTAPHAIGTMRRSSRWLR